MKNKKRSKKKELHPPLSILDKTLYATALIASIIAILLLYHMFDQIRSLLIFADSSVDAYSVGLTVGFVLPFLFYLLITVVSVISNPFLERKPLFGNDKIRYGEHPWSKEIYPRFGKQKRRAYLSPSKKRLRRLYLRYWLIGLLIMCLLLPFGFTARTCLYNDNHIETYNIFNVRNEKVYTEEDYSHLTVTIDKRYRRAGRSLNSYWVIELKIEMNNGREFVFNQSDFDGRDELVYVLDRMIDIKSNFLREDLTFEGEERIDDLVEAMNLNEEEAKLLFALFA